MVLVKTQWIGNATSCKSLSCNRCPRHGNRVAVVLRVTSSMTALPQRMLLTPARAAVRGYSHFNHFMSNVMLVKLVGSMNIKPLRTN